MKINVNYCQFVKLVKLEPNRANGCNSATAFDCWHKLLMPTL